MAQASRVRLSNQRDRAWWGLVRERQRPVLADVGRQVLIGRLELAPPRGGVDALPPGEVGPNRRRPTSSAVTNISLPWPWLGKMPTGHVVANR